MPEVKKPTGDRIAREFLAALRRRLSEERIRVEANAAPRARYQRLLARGRTLGYVNAGTRSLRVDVRTADGYTGFRIAGESDFAAPIAALVARAKEAA